MKALVTGGAGFIIEIDDGFIFISDKRFGKKYLSRVDKRYFGTDIAILEVACQGESCCHGQGKHK